MVRARSRGVLARLPRLREAVQRRVRLSGKESVLLAARGLCALQAHRRRGLCQGDARYLWLRAGCGVTARLRHACSGAVERCRLPGLVGVERMRVAGLRRVPSLVREFLLLPDLVGRWPGFASAART